MYGILRSCLKNVIDILFNSTINLLGDIFTRNWKTAQTDYSSKGKL